MFYYVLFSPTTGELFMCKAYSTAIYILFVVYLQILGWYKSVKGTPIAG